MLTRENEKIVFKDVAGCDEAKEEVSKSLTFSRIQNDLGKSEVKYPRESSWWALRAPARRFLPKPLQGNGVPFFGISGSDFVEMFVGVAQPVSETCSSKVKKRSLLIFIDEIDAVGRQRGAGLGGGNDSASKHLTLCLWKWMVLTGTKAL